MRESTDVTLHLTYDDALCVQDALRVLVAVSNQDFGTPYKRADIVAVVKAYVDLQIAKATNGALFDEAVERRVAQFQPRTYR